ncbi:phosphonatase-like hydrolase [Streptomyces oceani]|uniref:Haloacid dehalogenase n=1 Tax=Streptomyces oceani TaxID=1075402 RepID=A0A1E7KKI8_9ACTN|nr:phosphonatase-like hydrolase [Streptomyces oceani]OEV04403.1 haloacid dehalogenase [Streptomyces oceani]
MGSQDPAAPAGHRTDLVVLDMAGTTVADSGLVERAFTAAAERLGVASDSAAMDDMLAHVRATMGESKISVFRHLFGDETAAHRANDAFESAYAELLRAGHCAPVPGAAEAIAKLREAGREVVLTTGFARPTQDAIVDALGWRELVTLTVCPADVGGRGRPYPDMVLAALLRTGAAVDVRHVAVAGDTGYDMRSGLRAGAGVVAGVRTGAHDAGTLRAAGATHVLDSVAELPALLDRLSERGLGDPPEARP